MDKLVATSWKVQASANLNEGPRRHQCAGCGMRLAAQHDSRYGRKSVHMRMEFLWTTGPRALYDQIDSRACYRPNGAGMALPAPDHNLYNIKV
jgi:hypothetical protein